MNHNLNLKCEVCSNVVRLKIYGGHELVNPFAYSCPECNVTISGNLIWNEDMKEGLIKEFKCSNAVSVSIEDGKESHMLQIATEFFTDKIKEFNNADPTLFFSPFMMDEASFEVKQKKKNIVSFVTENFERDFVVTIRIWELYKKKNIKYLNRQLLFNGFIEPVPLGQLLKVDHDNKIMEVLYNPFRAFLLESGQYKKLLQFRSKLEEYKRSSHDEISALQKDLYELTTYSDENLVHLLTNFSNYYRYIWPIILSDIYKTTNLDDIKTSKGILTANFEILKNYYVEAFEILCSLLPVFLGLQNIRLRGKRNNFEEKISTDFPSIKTIIDYDKKVINKGNKVKYFERENIFSNIFDINATLNNSIRNSIGHHSYSYEADQQLIILKERNKTSNLFLIEFGEMLLKTFYASFTALEVIMFLKNIEE
ncbi:hypothetical protein [Robertmurraya sp. P23]|uniref:hypothetical protein n=1 Tax=Robertmurraya sp. P23 TaxID=3436931 RepID=UPI003D99DCC9